MAIVKVWIDEGCIVCNACEAECPEVFKVTDDSCHVVAAVREDGKSSENRAERSAIKADLRAALTPKIQAAVSGCPVAVIKVEEAPAAEAPTAEAPKAEAPTVETPKAEAPKPEAPKAEAPKAEAAAAPEAPAGPTVYDPAQAPNRQIVMPKTVPLPSLKAYREEQAALAAADEAKWQKTLADYETNKAKAEAEGKDAPKPPVRPVPKPDANDMKFPAPVEAADPDAVHLLASLGDRVQEIFQQAGELTCQVAPEAIGEVLALCKDDPSLCYEMLSDETATHYPAAEGWAFSVVYHLTSIRRAKRLRLRILIPEGFEPESALAAYPTANWLEREIFDMFGIRFKNHPDMTRILCPDDWEGYPLRKDYPTIGLGQREIDFREDRSGVLMRRAMEKAGFLGINVKPPTAD